jgi:hypothetical protein
MKCTFIPNIFIFLNRICRQHQVPPKPQERSSPPTTHTIPTPTSPYNFIQVPSIHRQRLHSSSKLEMKAFPSRFLSNWIHKSRFA